MSRAWSRKVQLFGIVALAGAALAAGCGGGGGNSGGFTPDGGDTGDGSVGASSSSGGGDAGDAGGFGNGPTLQSISISPLTAAITSTNGSKPSQQFTLQGKYSDGSVGALSSGVTWSADTPLVGAIDGTGKYGANGTLGGVVKVTASYGKQSASATLTVKLLLQKNGSNTPPGVQTGLQGATANDPNVTWAYPYDATVWPRGVLSPTLQWNGGAATDQYYVHIVSPTFELQDFTTATNAPSSQLLVDATAWQQFTDSTVGAATITVARYDGTNYTRIAKQGWTIAGASVRGTIYYWSNNLGRVLRIKPGAAQPDDFANQAPLNDPNQYTQGSCLMTCHTVSADGSTLVSGGGVFGGSYDLLTSTPTYYLGGTWGPTGGGANSSSVVRWMMPAVSPDGKYILTNSMAEGLAYANDQATQGFLGLFNTKDGTAVPNSGLANVAVGQPAWSPDGKRIVYVDTGDAVSANWFGSWNNPPPGDLKVYQFDGTKNPMVSGPTTLVATGSDPNHRIAWPTVTPDGQWVLYSRCAGADTRTVADPNSASGPSDLYFASAVTPNQEVRLAKLDGDGYPFAAGARDLSWNFEPSFAPVAAGGYFWVVFTSRRTLGNILTGVAEPVSNGPIGTKQLWVAAIDQNPKPGVDPSHPAFHLEGQDESNLAMRGFWALPPCSKNGEGCSSGTDCCGGYCSAGVDGGAPVCGSMPTGCSQNGNKCNATSDCCGASAGVTCINHVCSEPPPQ